MNTWLHFVGKSYYSIREFIAEAKHLGVSRRVSRVALKGMNWGDRILLASWTGKHAQVFGVFYVERISGLTPEAQASIAKRTRVEMISSGGRLIRRKCGSYIEGAAYAVDCSLRELADMLDDVENPGTLLIAGEFVEHPRLRLRDISHQMGYRKINYTKLMEAVRTATKQNPLVRGQFYVWHKDTTASETNKGAVGIVHDYKKREEEPEERATQERTTQMALSL